MKVLAATAQDFLWLAMMSGCVLSADFRAIKAVGEDGRIRGMVGYDNWAPNSVRAHMALDCPIAARALIRPAFSYPFEQEGKSLLIGIIPGFRERSVALALALGFREAHRFRDGWARGQDLVTVEMTKDECRWLRRPLRRAA